MSDIGDKFKFDDPRLMTEEELKRDYDINTLPQMFEVYKLSGNNWFIKTPASFLPKCKS